VARRMRDDEGEGRRSRGASRLRSSASRRRTGGPAGITADEELAHSRATDQLVRRAPSVGSTKHVRRVERSSAAASDSLCVERRSFKLSESTARFEPGMTTYCVLSVVEAPRGRALPCA